MASAGDVTGSLPDVVGMALGLSDAMSPDKGFAYNLCTFAIDLREAGGGKEGDGKDGEGKEKAPASMGAQPAASSSVQTRQGPVVFTVKLGSPGEGGPRTVVEVGIREVASRDRIQGVLELRRLDDFDTSILNNLALEIVAPEQSVADGSALLVLKGLVNPVGAGFAHFVGGVLVTARRGSGTPVLEARAQFVTQAPPTGAGAGIFGQVIVTQASGSAVSVWAYRAPLFSR